MEVNPVTQPEVPTQQDKNAAALSYIWLMGPIIYMAKRQRAFVRFHASQSIALFIASILVWFVPVIRDGLLAILGLLMIMGFLKAARGEYFRVPLFFQLSHGDNPVKRLLIVIQRIVLYGFLFIRSFFISDSSTRQALEKARVELFNYGKEQTSSSPPTQSDKKDMAAFGYLWILSIVVLAMHPDDDFVVFHASQGVVLFLVSVLFLLLPGIGFYLNVIVLLLIVTGFLMALNGEKYKLPVIGYFSDRTKTFEEWYLQLKTQVLYIFRLVSVSPAEPNAASVSAVSAQVRASYQAKKQVFIDNPVIDTDIAAASYFLLSPVVWLFHKNKPFVMFHARQAFFLLVFLILLLLIEPLRWASLLLAGMALFGAIRASQGQYYALPFIFDVVTSKLQFKDILASLSRIFSAVMNLFRRILGRGKATSNTNPPSSAS